MADEKKTDAQKLDQILDALASNAKRMDTMESSFADGMKRVDSVCARADADEKERKDAAKKADEDKKKADAAKADAEKEEEERKKADAAKADAAKKEAEEEERKKADAAKADAATLAGGEASKKLQEQIDALSRRLPAELSADLRQRMTGIQLRAEPVYQAFSDSAPASMHGESEMDYRIRLASKLQVHARNPKVKGAKLGEIKDSAALEVFEDHIYADALTEARNPSEVAPGVMIPHRIKDAAGREITRYSGQDGSCWDQFNPPVRYLRRILTPGTTRVQ